MGLFARMNLQITVVELETTSGLIAVEAFFPFSMVDLQFQGRKITAAGDWFGSFGENFATAGVEVTNEFVSSFSRFEGNLDNTTASRTSFTMTVDFISDQFISNINFFRSTFN